MVTMKLGASKNMAMTNRKETKMDTTAEPTDKVGSDSANRPDKPEYHLSHSLQKILPQVNGSNSTAKPAGMISPSPPQYDCPQCKDTRFFKRDVPIGDPNFGKLIPCDHPSHARDRLHRLARLSGMNIADKSLTIADIDPISGNAEMIREAKRMIRERYGWLYIWGKHGNAKTVALKAIVNALQSQGHTAMYVNLGRLVNWMREAFGERKKRESNPDADLGYIARFDRVKAIEVLAIDEMDKIRDTELAQEFIFAFLNERYEQADHGQTITIFADNSDPATLPPALWDRVSYHKFKVVENRAKSLRPFGRKPK